MKIPASELRSGDRVKYVAPGQNGARVVRAVSARHSNVTVTLGGFADGRIRRASFDADQTLEVTR